MKIFNTSKAPRMSQVFPQAVIANDLIILLPVRSLMMILKTKPGNAFKISRSSWKKQEAVLAEW
jgi:hypothetical protein